MLQGPSFPNQYAIADHQGNTRILFTSAAQTPVAKTATFETSGGDDSEFVNIPTPVSFTAANHTNGGSKVVRMNQTNPVGPAKSLKVYAGDKVDMEVYGYYENTQVSPDMRFSQLVQICGWSGCVTPT